MLFGLPTASIKLSLLRILANSNTIIKVRPRCFGVFFVHDLDIVIPVRNEEKLICRVFDTFIENISASYRVIICYDFDDETSLAAIENYPNRKSLDILLVKNPGRGVHQAIKSGFDASTAQAVLCYMGDDLHNAGSIDFMLSKMKEGFDIVTASRYMKGGTVIGGVWYKKFLSWLASITLYHLARFPVRDATNGIRMFSRNLLEAVEVESTQGFTFVLEMLVKAVRLKCPIYEISAKWVERSEGESGFQIMEWFHHYLRWYLYAFNTTWLHKAPNSVRLKKPLHYD